MIYNSFNSNTLCKMVVTYHNIVYLESFGVVSLEMDLFVLTLIQQSQMLAYLFLVSNACKRFFFYSICFINSYINIWRLFIRIDCISIFNAAFICYMYQYFSSSL